MGFKPPSVKLLESMGYEVYWWGEEPSEPERVNKRFRDVITGLASLEIGEMKLYKHQYETLKALKEGFNVILTARTGSGKTEAWALAALKESWRVLAVYPTLALSADQIKRLEKYYEVTHSDKNLVVRIDRPTLGKRSRESILTKLGRAKVVVTNPAFLLAEIKRIAQNPSRSLLYSHLSDLDLIVIDELDFYGPRAAHLILEVIELIIRYIASGNPRIVVLSATLGNPHELSQLLSKINGRKTIVIEGRPFRVKNYVIVVLGKNIDSLKNYILAHSDIIRSKAPWILEFIEDDKELREHLYEIYDGLEAIGLYPPRPGINPSEIVAATLKDAGSSGVTLVFTRSIRHAERTYREILEHLSSDNTKLVAVHHHLIPKGIRESIEEDARTGRIRAIITVRTLAQGIDIGSISRVVHVGLPLDLREYLQREGRKGRRKEIEFTETIIIPSGLWDRKLLEMGASALKEWLELPLEKLYVTPANKYSLVFRAMWKLIRGIGLEEEEAKILKELGLVEQSIDALGRPRLSLNERGKRFWSDIGFYEHGPPYGYKKVVISKGRSEVLPEEISYRDLVEKYQPGCFDPTTELIVTNVSSRERRIYEQSIEDAVEEHEWLAAAVARYEDIKRAWGEKPGIESDIRYGRVYPIVEVNVRAPFNGFGELIEEPFDVKWIIESRRPRLAAGKGIVRVYRETGVVHLGSPVKGQYRNYTYGYIFEAPGSFKSDDVRLGLSMLIVFLRASRKYSIPLSLLRYTVTSLGGVRVIHLWESDAAGLIENLNWLEIARDLKKFKPIKLIIPLLSAVDPFSGLRLLRGEASVEDALSYAASIAETIGGLRTIRREGFKIIIPRGKLENTASIALAYEKLGNNQVLAIAGYDGNRVIVKSTKVGVGIYESASLAQTILEVLDMLLSRGYKVYYYGVEQRMLFIRLLSASYVGLTMFRTAEAEGKLIDAAEQLKEKTGLAPLLTVMAPKLKNYGEWLLRAKQRNDLDEVENSLKSIVVELAKGIYALLLAAYRGRIERLERDS